ncbi:MAG: sugar transferase [Gemmatimonadaceae bacterium]
MKRVLDIVLAAMALVLLAPMMLVTALLIWIYDFRSPLYPGRRVGRDGRVFRMAKLRTMVVNADTLGVLSTARDDARLTPIGRVVRRWKVDELPQLWNVLKGDMSFVGPRPNVPREVALYSVEEQRLLTVRPGLTDFASIVFSDLAAILEGSADPNGDYNRLVRPWKSRYGLHYVGTRSFSLDIALIALTTICLVSRQAALRGVRTFLRRTAASDDLIRFAERDQPLVPTLPPGVTEETWEGHLTYH